MTISTHFIIILYSFIAAEIKDPSKLQHLMESDGMEWIRFKHFMDDIENSGHKSKCLLHHLFLLISMSFYFLKKTKGKTLTVSKFVRLWDGYSRFSMSAKKKFTRKYNAENGKVIQHPTSDNITNNVNAFYTKFVRFVVYY